MHGYLAVRSVHNTHLFDAQLWLQVLFQGPRHEDCSFSQAIVGPMDVVSVLLLLLLNRHLSVLA